MKNAQLNKKNSSSGKFSAKLENFPHDRKFFRTCGKIFRLVIFPLDLRGVWSLRRLSQRLKLKIFNSNVKPVLLYACETWKVTKALSHRLQVFINRCLRRICGIYYPEIISNKDLYIKTQQGLVADEIGKRKWNWIGHTLRKDPADITRQAMSWNPPGKRKPGRQCITWQSSVRKEAAQQGKQWNELAGLAQNRVRFGAFVNALHFIVE